MKKKGKKMFSKAKTVTSEMETFRAVPLTDPWVLLTGLAGFMAWLHNWISRDPGQGTETLCAWKVDKMVPTS